MKRQRSSDPIQNAENDLKQTQKQMIASYTPTTMTTYLILFHSGAQKKTLQSLDFSSFAGFSALRLMSIWCPRPESNRHARY